jgi:hypothetical protein
MVRGQCSIQSHIPDRWLFLPYEEANPACSGGGFCNHCSAQRQLDRRITMEAEFAEIRTERRSASTPQHEALTEREIRLDLFPLKACAFYSYG